MAWFVPTSSTTAGDGNGAHAAIAFGYLPNRPVLTASDFVVIGRLRPLRPQ